MGGLSFLAPFWLFAAPAFLGALVLLYFLKLKRHEVTIGSTYLWQSALNDLRVNSPFQRLRMNLLLILQFLALLLILLALARPILKGGALEGNDVVILIDVSASMQATDAGGKTRFAKAKEEAKKLVEGLAYGDRGTLVAFSDEARVLTDLTESKAALRQALDELQPTDRPTAFGAALHRVRAMLNRGERTPILYVISDGRVGSLEGVSLSKEVPLNYVKVGQEGENVGIVGVDVHVASGFGDETKVFASVLNKTPRKVRLGVDMYVDGELLKSRALDLGPGGVKTVPFAAPRLEGKLKRVRLVLDPADAFGGKGDAFPRDDTAYALLSPPEPVKVLLVSANNMFLHRALSADPNVRKLPSGMVPLLAPDDFDPQDTKLADYDVIVLDGKAAKSLPAGNYLIFGAKPPFAGFEDRGQAEDSRVLDWDETAPLTRFVNFASLVMPTCRDFKVRAKDKVIARATHGPLVIDAREGERRAIVCAFDLLALPAEGAWTFDPSFPIFLSNAVRILAGRGGEESVKRHHTTTGGSTELRFPAGSAQASVTPPGEDAEPWELKILAGDESVHLSRLDKVGVYAVNFKDAEGKVLETRQLAANLASSAEAEIGPAETFVIEDREVKGEGEAVETNRELWKYLAMVALALVLLEWWIYNRRVYV